MNQRAGVSSAPGARRTLWIACVCAVAITSCSRPAFDSPESRLRWLWDGYTRTYLNPEGFIRDPLRGGFVTSEAQSYALLQAAWLDDRETFDRVLRWTAAHLRRDDGLHSWLWDPSGDGRVVDVNTATDADVDIAFALILASSRFDDARYLEEARTLVRAIRHFSVVEVGDRWLPSAGNWAGDERIVNLSYFAPYAYDYFERIDPASGWREASDAGYALLEQALAAAPGRLPPDFLRVSHDGTIEELPPHSRLSQSFSFDGIRIVWRVELDCRLTGRPRACAMEALVGVLDRIRQRDGRFVTAYDPAGRPLTSQQSVSFYGAFLPAFARVRPSVAGEWRGSMLSDRQLTRIRSAGDRYYDANWVWFGLALADGVLVARTPTPESFELD